MKKVIMLCLVVFVSLNLVGCGKSEALKAAENAIKSIGEVTLDRKTAIEEAKALVDALTEEDLAKLKILDMLMEAQDSYDALYIESLIDKLKNVTINSQGDAIAARSAYDKANDIVKSKVSNYNLLEEAEIKIRELKEEAAREAEEARQREEKRKAAEVSALIEAIGNVTLDSKESIEKAQSEFSKLSSETKELVTNSMTLYEAQGKYKELLEKAYKEALSRMRVKEDIVQNTTFYLPKRMPEYINSRCNLSAYIGLQSSHVWLIIRYNYAGDDWVFFEKVILAVDDARYTKNFSYGDLTRDNGGGMVGEYTDVTNVGESDIKMLREICKSTHTIVRFEGDDYYHDYTLTNEDKKAIKDALIIYEYLTSK